VKKEGEDSQLNLKTGAALGNLDDFANIVGPTPSFIKAKVCQMSARILRFLFQLVVTSGYEDPSKIP
jgi:hypothetical protein